eukprot:COSAG02_NODE_45073_length_360_cov_1.130268_1_plen_45_part_10
MIVWVGHLQLVWSKGGLYSREIFNDTATIEIYTTAYSLSLHAALP